MNGKENKPLRVAVYCRLASDNQISRNELAREYTRQIRSHENWALTSIYMDIGVPASPLSKRIQLNRLLADCRKGRIDRVLVKSISRFARNTRDCLASLRELSRMGVTVYFEKENIDTGTLTTELMVSVSGSLAQQESTSISQNQRLSYQRRMERGKFITCKAPFGYRLTDGKNLETVPEEAVQVRWMFESYLSGHSLDWIAEQMTQKGVPTTDGKPFWQHTTVLYVLTNEKYIGDTLCQKTFASGFPFIKQRNHGERDQYYIENTHPAIVSKEMFKKTQELLRRKSSRKTTVRHPYPLTLKVRCGKCGTPFVRREGKSGLVVWSCRKHDKKASDCPVGRIPETELCAAFIRMYNKLKLNDGIVLKPVLRQLEDLNTALQKNNPAMLEINKAIAQATEQSHNISTLQTRGLLDADACAAKFSAVNAQLTQLRAERRRLLKNDDIEDAMDTLRQTVDVVRHGPERLDTFDETLFDELVAQIIAESQTRVRFRLHGGMELTEQLREAAR